MIISLLAFMKKTYIFQNFLLPHTGTCIKLLVEFLLTLTHLQCKFQQKIFIKIK